MKKLFLLVATVLFCFACTNTKDVVTVTVNNPLAMERSNEMVEVAMSDITNQLKLADTAQIVVLNADGQQVPYQITYDEKVIFRQVWQLTVRLLTLSRQVRRKRLQ